MIYVLAGVNGAGKSSIGGALLRKRKLDYYNPDEFAREVRRLKKCIMEQANSEAWKYGKEKLEAAIRHGTNHAFETTLGGRTIPALLMLAARAGHEVIVWYCGLSSPEMHMRRVAARVAAGGHDIPQDKIRERWRKAPANLIALLPHISELRVFDNSASWDAAARKIPPPCLVLHVKGGKVLYPPASKLGKTPHWAKPIVEAAWVVDAPPQGTNGLK